MASISKTFTTVLTPGEASATLFLREGQTFDWTAVGTIDAGCQVALQVAVGGGSAWQDIKRWQAGSVSASGSIRGEGGPQRFRFLAVVALQDPAINLVSFVATMVEAVDSAQIWLSPEGVKVLAVTDDGVESPKVTGTVVTDGSATLTQGSLTLPLGAIQSSRSGVSGAIVRGFGATAVEGMQEAIVDETVSFAANAALHKELTYLFPANAVIVSAQANIQAALTGGGTTAKVGLGTAADPDVYGLSSALTKNAKIDTQPDAAAGLASPLALRLSACAANGAAGDTALTVGSVRVRIVYRALVSLTDA